MRLYTYFLLMLAITSRLCAVLDGRMSPTFVSTTYTFSNYEWARGEVYFEQGFNVPGGVTAILGLSVPVGGTIALDSTISGNPSGIILELPLLLGTGGISVQSQARHTIATSNGEEGVLVFLSGANISSNPLVFLNDMRLDLAAGVGYVGVGSSFTLYGDTSKKLTIQNGLLHFSSSSDHPIIVGGDVQGSYRHSLIFDNAAMAFKISDPLIHPRYTFTTVDVTASYGALIFYPPEAGATIQFYGALSIGDDAILKGYPDLDFVLTSSIETDDYFRIGGRGCLSLSSNIFSFDRPLRFPFPLSGSTQQLQSRILIDGNCTFSSMGLGSERMVRLGAGTALTYTVDALLDIGDGAHLILDNVVLENRNFFA